jgi:hypothetical protein
MSYEEITSELDFEVTGECPCCNRKFHVVIDEDDFYIEEGDEWGHEKTKICVTIRCPNCKQWSVKKFIP